VRTWEHRLGALIAFVVLLWSGRAHAFAVSPSTPTCPATVIGASSTCSGDLSHGPGGMYDLLLDSTCDASEWSISPTAVNLSAAKTITATFTPQGTTGGTRTCKVLVTEKNMPANVVFDFDFQGTAQTKANIQLTVTLDGNSKLQFPAVRYNNSALSGASSTRNITVSNLGDQPLDIMNVTISPGGSAFAVTAGGTGTATINKGSPRTYTVTFNPDSPAGTKNATITFNTVNDDNGDDPAVTLEGIATTATIDVDNAATIDYGTVNEGGSRTMEVKVQNPTVTNGGPLGVTRAQISGGSWFTFTNCSNPNNRDCQVPFSVANGSSSLVGVKCEPPIGAGTSPQNATVTFTSDTDSGTDNSVALTCLPGVIQVAASVNTVDFGSKLVVPGGGTPVTAQVTVTNTGTVDAALTFAKSSGDPTQFDVVCLSNPCTAVKQAGLTPGTAMFQVTWTPISEGDVFTSLDVNLNGGTRNGPSMSLAGRGVDKHLGLLSDLEFLDTFRNPGDKAPKQVVPIRNTGEYPLTVQSITVTGEPVWYLAQPFAEFTVDPGATVDVEVAFAPTDEGKAPMGTLTVDTDDIRPATDPQTINLSGVGKLRNVDLAPGSIDVGDTFAGIPTKLSLAHPDEYLTVLNMDVETFTITDIQILTGDASAFQLVNADGSAFTSVDIEPTASRTFDIVFSPEVPGEHTSTIVLFLDQDDKAAKTIPIRGNAVYIDAHGAGGCSAGGQRSGGLVVICVAGLFVLRRRRR
jgi:hypothetical protein